MKSIKKKVAAVVYWKYADLNSRLLSNNIELVHGLRALILTSGGSRTTHQLSDQVNWIYERGKTFLALAPQLRFTFFVSYSYNFHINL